MMNNSTVWYSIHHPDYAHCAQGQTLIGSLPEKTAEMLAEKFLLELQYVTGLGSEIKVWVD
jgi:hypothetical protein